MVDLTITIGVILGLSAIIAPIFTTFISCHYQLKLKRLELSAADLRFQQQRIIDIYDAYATAAGACILNSTSDALKAFGAASAKAMLYAPENVLPDMQELASKIEAMDYSSCPDLLNEITKSLRASVQTVNK